MLTLRGHLKQCHCNSAGQSVTVLAERRSYEDSIMLFPSAMKPKETYLGDRPNTGLNLTPVNFQNVKLCFHVFVFVPKVFDI